MSWQPIRSFTLKRGMCRLLVLEEHCTATHPPVEGDKQTQALLLGASFNTAFMHRWQRTKVKRLCTNIFEVMTLYFLLFFFFSTLRHTLIVVTQQIVFFCNPYPNKDLLDILFFNVHVVKFILCSTQFYGVWQMHRVMFLPPQYHVEHPITLKITQYSPFVQNLSVFPQLLATTDLFSVLIDVPFQ